jgi:transcriptional regulator GlxA family with amidase domain
LLWRCGPESRLAMPLTGCMESHYQQRSPLTSYANMAGQCPSQKKRYPRLRREKLVRAVEYIQDQLDTDLTVAGIAQAVGISRYHFTKLFKESTGQSPYQYVVETRVKKAKELLTTGRFTISEVAHHVGFADQSHLTRHFKRVFGLPPQKLLRRLQNF